MAWPARVEVVSRRPTVVIDAAHNVASIDALLEALDESVSARRRVLVFATTKDKDARGMLERLLPRFDTAVFTRYANNPRSVSPEELARLAFELTGREFPATVDTSLGLGPGARADRTGRPDLHHGIVFPGRGDARAGTLRCTAATGRGFMRGRSHMKMFVAGQWVDKPEKIEVRNPYDGSVIDTVPKADAADVERAIAGAVEGRGHHAGHARLRAVPDPPQGGRR